MSSKSTNPPKRHHYAPQFFLRNFAIDSEKKKVTVLSKHGRKAVWAKKSIKSIAFENDLYVHIVGSIPVSVEEKINSSLEDPISKSNTWKKIAAGAAADLDHSDRAILYSLVRNFEVRTPHYRNTLRDLSILAGQPDSGMNFSDDEKEMYAVLRADPGLMSEMANEHASSLEWTEREFSSCGISIWRVREPTYVCSTPVHILKSPDHPRLRATQLGFIPYNHLMPLTPRAYICLSLGDFDGYFTNEQVDPVVEAALKRQIVSQFSYWPTVRHMICPADNLVEQLRWAGYNCVHDTPKKKSFLRD
ncbi:DUF4238 domain-containing protein [Amorphus sp. MBR-141]